MNINFKKYFRLNYLPLLIFLTIGSYLRLFGVFTNSFAFTYDVGRDMLALYNIVHFHKLVLIGATTGLPGVFYGPWWYYFLTPFFILFSGNPQGIAFLMAVIGILLILFAYILGKKIGGNEMGIIMSGLVSVSPNLISLSSQIWNPNIAPLFVIFTLFSIYKIITSKNPPIHYLILGFLLAINMDLEIVFGLLLSVGIVLSILIVQRPKIKPKSIVLFIIGFLIVFLPRIVFDLRHQFLMSKSFMGFFIHGGSSGSTSIFALLVNRSNFMFDQFNSTISNGSVFLGLILILFIFFSLFISKKEKDVLVTKFTKISIITIFVFLLGTLFFSHDIWPHYLVGLPIFFILLVSIALYKIKEIFKNRFFAYSVFILLFLINLNPISILNGVTKPVFTGDASVYRNQLLVIDYAYTQAKGRNFKYVVYTPPVNDYTYQYLFLWYGPKKFGYSPLSQSSLAFFILEPDHENPQRLKDWMKQRSGDGKIIKSEAVKGGIIVETRIH